MFLDADKFYIFDIYIGLLLIYTYIDICKLILQKKQATIYIKPHAKSDYKIIIKTNVLNNKILCFKNCKKCIENFLILLFYDPQGCVTIHCSLFFFNIASNF